MIKIRVGELSGPALDWAVAQVKGRPLTVYEFCGERYFCADTMENDLPEWSPSRIWGQGGFLIDEYKLEFVRVDGGFACVREWDRDRDLDYVFTTWPTGETHLIAACRAVVNAELGDVIEVPDDPLKR